MAYLIGAILAVMVGGIASLLRLDRDRAFYPTVLIVIASYYALFAVMGGTGVLAVEVTVAHGVFDALHDRLIANPGVPVWWPQFCFTYDIVAAGYLAGLLLRRAVPAR